MNVTFAVPTLPTSGMSVVEQRLFVNQQVTAVIISAYLEHLNATIEKGPTLAANPPLNATNILSPQELVNLIDMVQHALS